MKKLILIAAALVMASGASAYAQGEYSASKHRRYMASYAQMPPYEPGAMIYRPQAPSMVAPPFGYYSVEPYRYYGSADARYGLMDEESAIGRTND